jgi:hypothetical protein
VRTACKLLTTGSAAVAYALTLLLAPTAAGALANFDGDGLGDVWAVRSTGDAEFVVEDGWLRVDVPGAHWLAWIDVPGAEPSLAPMFLVAPPPDAAGVSFDTRLRFESGARSPQGAAAGLALVRKDLGTAVLLQAVREANQMRFEWWWEGGLSGGQGPRAFGSSEDLWLRFEHLGSHFAVSRKARERDEWEDITALMSDTLSNIAHLFPPGEFLVGLFVTSGLGPDDDVEVSFDYFNSPQISALDVEPEGKAAVVWGGLKRASY